MTRTIQCKKLKKEGEGLSYQPIPGELGKRIYENISKEAWDKWIDLQTMLINEYHLNMLEQESREFIDQAMRDYFFGE